MAVENRTMMFPAWYDLATDDEIARYPTALRVYARLLQDQRILTEPRDVKAWLLAHQLEVRRATVYRALDLLVGAGYLVDYGRGENNIRRLRVALVRAGSAPERTPAESLPDGIGGSVNV